MRNIFLVHTEYHLIVTIRMVISCLKEDDNIVYYTTGRLHKNQFDKQNSYGIVFKELPNKNYGVKTILNEILFLQPDQSFFFQDNSSDNIYLMYHFQKRGIKVSLVQDGYKPYPIWHRKHLPLVIVKETFEFYRQMFRRRSVIPSLFLQSYKYGSLRYINELWLEYPDRLPYNTHKNKRLIPAFTEESLSVCNIMFNYKPDVVRENIILYVGQPLRSELMRKKEVEIIEAIVHLHPDMKFIYRPHPLLFKEQLDCICRLDGVVVYDRAIPIELLMVSLKNSIVVSPWSAALLTANKDCRYYWIHKLFYKDSNIQKDWQMEIVNPTDHIIEVNGIEEIK